MKSKVLFTIGIFLVMLTACDNFGNSEPEDIESETTITQSETQVVTTTTAETKPLPIIEKINVTKQPLSEISTDESDEFIKKYNNRQLFFDDNGGYYYNIIFDGYTEHSTRKFLFYDKGDGKPVDTNLPEIGWFYKPYLFYDGALYGLLCENDENPEQQEWFIVKYQNGKTEKITNINVDCCYFAKEGIYYQTEKSIYLMDYDGEKLKLIVDIPDELYTNNSLTANFVVYRGVIWFDNKPNSLWSYNLENKTFMQFNEGGMEMVNNGYLYYTDMHKKLWRFNVDTFCAELVSDMYCGSANFTTNSILFVVDDYENQGLYKLNSEGETKIFAGNFTGVDIYDNEIYVHENLSGEPNENRSVEHTTKIMEIDLNGKVIKKICEYTPSVQKP